MNKEVKIFLFLIPGILVQIFSTLFNAITFLNFRTPRRLAAESGNSLTTEHRMLVAV
jgi:hypothetical protein